MRNLLVCRGDPYVVARCFKLDNIVLRRASTQASPLQKSKSLKQTPVCEFFLLKIKQIRKGHIKGLIRSELLSVIIPDYGRCIRNRQT